MKNFIPLILAVLLGLAAVLAVGRMLSANKGVKEDTIEIVVSARDIGENEMLTEDAVMKKVIPVSAMPAQSILWKRSQMVEGQKALRPIMHNDYVLLSDIGFSRSIANIVGEGEWAVSLNLGSSGLVPLIQPGDEVAVIATLTIVSVVKSADLSAEEEQVEKEATLVLFPRVRVLDVPGRSGDDEQGGSELIIALRPQQAQIMISAQRNAELSVALRRPNDDSNLSRVDAGMVEDSTFDALTDQLEAVNLPVIPSAAGNTP